MTRFTKTEVHPPRAGWRIFLTLVLFALCIAASVVVQEYAHGLTSAAAAAQAQGDAEAYRIARMTVLQNIPFYLAGVTVLAVLGIWMQFALKMGAYIRLPETPDQDQQAS